MQPNPPLPPVPPPAARPVAGASTAKIVYVLYLVSLAVGVTALVGVVMAYVNVGDAPEPIRTHYRFQIRTFWIGALQALLGLVLMPLLGLGGVVWVFAVVWLVVRAVKGLRHLDRGEPYPDPGTWLW